jgi:segregation and condensation protein A
MTVPVDETSPDEAAPNGTAADQNDDTSDSAGDVGRADPVEQSTPVEPPLDLLADGITERQTYAVQLDVFEGPLDLLLHLVRRHELDILDIPISFVASKYIEYLEFARALDIEVAGEYLVMAATLAYLKSRELLPPEPTDELDEEEVGVDPREELMRRLLEYERFRAAGDDLDGRPVIGRDVFSRGGDQDVAIPAPDLAVVDLFKLAEAYNRVLDRAEIRAATHEVELEPVTVRERMEQLTLLLREDGAFDFENMFLSRVWTSERELRSMLVVTLMSVLELVKLGVVEIHQAHGTRTLEVKARVETEVLTKAVESYTEDED